jgi:hypothetical protein
MERNAVLRNRLTQKVNRIEYVDVFMLVDGEDDSLHRVTVIGNASAENVSTLQSGHTWHDSVDGGPNPAHAND